MTRNRIGRVAGAALLAAAGLGFGGCRLSHDGGLHSEWTRQLADWDPHSEPEATASTEKRDPAAERTGEDQLAVTGPEDYVRLALERNPGIRAARLRVERLLEHIPQVSSLDDPTIGIAPIGEMAETAAGQVSVMTSVSQRLPFPGKLASRARVAAQEVAVAAQELEATRLRVKRDTRSAYWSYYYATRAIEVIDADRRLLAQFREIAAAKYRSGTVSQQDVLRASVELSNLDNELVTLRQRETTAVALLNRLLDRSVVAPLPPPAPISLEPTVLELDRLLEEAGARNPALQAIRERIQGFRERLELAELQRRPDFVVGLNYNLVQDEGVAPSANGDDQWWIGLGLNLPIWTERLDAAERQARAGIREGIAQLNDEQNLVAFRLQDGLVRLDTQQRLVELFRDVIVPQARQTVEASESSYRAGGLDFLTLVDNWRKLLDFQLMLHRSLAEFERSFADVQEVVGVDLNRGLSE